MSSIVVYIVDTDPEHVFHWLFFNYFSFKKKCKSDYFDPDLI